MPEHEHSLMLAARYKGGEMSDWFAKTQGPAAHETRGKTAQHRLRRLDRFLHAFEPGLLSRAGAVAVDLGYGRVPITTIEWFERAKKHHPGLRMVGIEREPERVRAAEAMLTPALVDAGLGFRLGDFKMPVKAGESVVLTRAMNVLRQYEESAAVDAHALILNQMVTGGLLAEGTCDPFGRRMVVALLRRTAEGVICEGVLFACSLRDPVDPRGFQAVLPKHLIHRMVAGEAIHAFFSAWERAAVTTRGQAEFGHRQHFVAVAEMLAQTVKGIETRRSWLRNGWLFWRGAPYP